MAPHIPVATESEFEETDPPHWLIQFPPTDDVLNKLIKAGKLTFSPHLDTVEKTPKHFQRNQGPCPLI